MIQEGHGWNYVEVLTDMPMVDPKVGLDGAVIDGFNRDGSVIPATAIPATTIPATDSGVLTKTERDDAMMLLGYIIRGTQEKLIWLKNLSKYEFADKARWPRLTHGASVTPKNWCNTCSTHRPETQTCSAKTTKVATPICMSSIKTRRTPLDLRWYWTRRPVAQRPSSTRR